MLGQNDQDQYADELIADMQQPSHPAFPVPDSGTGPSCDHCRKPIKGRMIISSPPLVKIVSGIDFDRTYHPACYRLAGHTQKPE